MKNILIAVAALAVLPAVRAADSADACEKPFKILMIGNSFSICNLKQMPHVAKTAGIRLDLASLYIGGCPLSRHWNNVTKADGDPSFKPYRFDRVVDGKPVVSKGKANIQEALVLDKWDVVTVQQASSSSWRPETYEPYGGSLITKIRELAPQARILVQETWSYPPWDKRLKGFGFDQREMYVRLHRTYAEFAKRYSLDVIPVGTAAEIVPGRNSLFTKPDFHFNQEGQYLQGVVFTAKIFGKDARKLSYRPDWLDPARAEEIKEAAAKAVEGRGFSLPGFVERPYDFRRRLEKTHESWVRDMSLKPAADEFAFADGAVVAVPDVAGEVLLTAARDFVDYMFVSQRTSVRLAAGSCATEGGVEIQTSRSLLERQYSIETSARGVKIVARDERAAAQALYHLEDLMNLRLAPYLRIGNEKRRSLFSPRMTHSGWGVDAFPDEHLAQIAHAGMDAIVIFVKDVDKTKGAEYQDVRDTILRAKRYGLDTYLYSYVVAFVHPDDPDAKDRFASTYGRIAAAYPEAKGMVFVGESCQFPTKDERAQPRTNKNRIPGDKRPCAGWWPCRDYPDWLRGVKAAICAEAPGMEIVFWSYNWGRQPAQPRMELIDSLPRDVTLMATFEMFEPQVKRNGLSAPSSDYSLSFEGPGQYFSSEAERAHGRGLKLYSMSNTGGLTWDYGVIPYQPCPYQWKRRYDGVLKARKDWGLSGLMECHHYGWWPSFVSELEKEAFTEGGIPFDEHIRAIAARDFGAENAEKAIEAWKLWSDAARDYVASDANQYGPFRIGPAYPFHFGGDRIANEDFPCPPYASFGVRIARLNYYLDRSLQKPAAGEAGKQSLEKANKEIEILEMMRSALAAGADIFEGISAGSEKARRMAALGRFMQRTATTAINVKRGVIACRTGDKAGLLRLARDEYANAKAALPLVEADSRLGWEPSMEYVGGPEQIRWKLRMMESLYGKAALAEDVAPEGAETREPDANTGKCGCAQI